MIVLPLDHCAIDQIQGQRKYYTWDSLYPERAAVGWSPNNLKKKSASWGKFSQYLSLNG